ncbi:UNVERIFIED_CONTAM: hypothetical protein K2H54_005331 [Gekko kuhli]
MTALVLSPLQAKHALLLLPFLTGFGLQRKAEDRKAWRELVHGAADSTVRLNNHNKFIIFYTEHLCLGSLLRAVWQVLVHVFINRMARGWIRKRFCPFHTAALVCVHITFRSFVPFDVKMNHLSFSGFKGPNEPARPLTGGGFPRVPQASTCLPLTSVHEASSSS